MCYNNQYGTLCSYAWDINEAIVTCNQLGYFGKSIYILYLITALHLTYIGTATAFSNAYFGQGTGQILLSGLGCTGTETSLFSCSFSNVIGSTNCSHSQDVGVACSTS